MPDLALLSAIAIVALALVFDFTNGFHDAANSIVTVVSTRVLTPGSRSSGRPCSIASAGDARP
jgi:hypothetical protein